MYRWDLDFEEGWENIALDYNENGINDGLEQQFSPTVWASHPAAPGGVSNPTGIVTVLNTTANLLDGWFDSGDWDQDQVIDVNDCYPFNSSCSHLTDACS